MPDATNPGIDYGLGQTNIDRTTGIRYGVISQHSLNPDAFSDIEPDYGDPTCPDCSGKVAPSTGEYLPGADWMEKDYVCRGCEKYFFSHQVFPVEPVGHNYQDRDYTITGCLDADLLVTKSPYYTHAQFCSPSVPGAGNLDHPCPTGPKTYCLGHYWFDGERAPYPVYRESDDAEVEP